MLQRYDTFSLSLNNYDTDMIETVCIGQWHSSYILYILMGSSDVIFHSDVISSIGPKTADADTINWCS